MALELKIPARINILGNLPDGLEGDFATISAAVHVFAGAFIRASDYLVIERLAGLRSFFELDQWLHNDYVLAELTQRVEAKELGFICGFEQGAGWANNLLIEAALNHGALGAKLTGAGGGGSVFALVNPGQEESLMEIWRHTVRREGLDAAQVYQVQVVHHGLEIHEL
jgi:galactokinase